MKNYISELSDDELEWLCCEIPCKKYEDFFRDNHEDFNEINIKNYRDKLRLEKFTSVILKKIHLDSVILFLNKNADSILLDFSKALNNNEYSITDQELLMAETLRLFHFGGRVALYFKLSDDIIPEYNIEKLNEVMRMLDLKNFNDWNFGMATLSENAESMNLKAVINVKNTIEKSELILEKEIIDSISWLKGMFNRIIRHDCWDWYTVNSYFNYPSYADLHAIVFSLSNLRKAIINDDNVEKCREMINLINHNFLEYCYNYLTFASEKENIKNKLKKIRS